MSDVIIKDDLNNEEPTVEEKLETISNVINEATQTEENKFYDSLPSNNGVLERTDTSDTDDLPVESEVDVAVDPVTGNFTQVAAKKLDLDEELVEMLDIKPEDLLDIPESIDDLQIPDELIMKNIKESAGIEDAEMVAEILAVIKKYRSTGKEFRPNINWYEKLPKMIRDIIDQQCFQVNNPGAKKVFAEAFIDEIISGSGMDNIILDMQDSMNKAFDTSGLTDYIMEESRTEFEKNMELTMERTKTAQGIEEEKRAELLAKQEAVMKAYNQAYTLTDFLDAVTKKKIRVKPFDIQKYKRWLQEFYTKYEGDTPFTIGDPSTIPPILFKFFDKKYTAEQCVAFVIAFIKFTRNMSSKDVVDHTFMSYFIHNITQLQLVTHKTSERDFINILSNNIETAIKAINDIEDVEKEEESEE